MIEFILQNAISTVRIDGVVDPFLTPLGNVAGQFYTGYDFYDFEIEGDTVYYLPAYRADGAKGKKCPGGYWIPRSKECKKGVMTPSAKGKVGGAKAALAVALMAGGAAAASAGISGAATTMGLRRIHGSEMPTQPQVETPTPKGLAARAKQLAGDRRVQAGAAIAGVGTAGAIAYSKKDQIKGAIDRKKEMVARKREEDDMMKQMKDSGETVVDRQSARLTIDYKKAEKEHEETYGNLRDEWDSRMKKATKGETERGLSYEEVRKEMDDVNNEFKLKFEGEKASRKKLAEQQKAIEDYKASKNSSPPPQKTNQSTKPSVAETTNSKTRPESTAKRQEIETPSQDPTEIETEYEEKKKSWEMTERLEQKAKRRLEELEEKGGDERVIEQQRQYVRDLGKEIAENRQAGMELYKKIKKNKV